VEDVERRLAQHLFRRGRAEQPYRGGVQEDNPGIPADENAVW
jgi:hypothetical protein